MKKILECFFLLWLVFIHQKLLAYDVETHRSLSQRATQSTVSSLDQTLKNELGLLDGVEQRFLGREVRLAVGDGSRFEDSPSWRVLNHFHNPLADQWQNGGLNVLGGLARGQSSLLWQQNGSQNTSAVVVPSPFPPFVGAPLPIPSLGGNWSWQDARARYLHALTASSKSDRDEAFSELFINLGHLVHLVQDASVPAHVRNDPHLIHANPDWYEEWIKETRKNNAELFVGLLNAFDKEKHKPPLSIFAPTDNNDAPVPIARLIDHDKFLGTNFGVLTDAELGVAEYTNGNFLSRDTMFRNFDLPRLSSLKPGFLIEPLGTKFRRYRSKVSEGETIDHFITEGLLYESMSEASGGGPVPAGGWTLDELNVQRDYAEKLIPRAVGYSAGLLDYFFRGRLDVEAVVDPEDPTKVKLNGTNGSPDDLVDGDLELYADRPDGTRVLVPAIPSSAIAGVAPEGEIPSPTYELSEEAERFVAVYKGTLGNEVRDQDNNFPGAVIGKVLGGVRVEELFNDRERWYLRTPKDVYPLPIFTDQVEVLKWGDLDNTLVGRSRWSSGDPTATDANQFFAYEIARPVGSSEVPTRNEERVEPDGTVVVEQIVDLEQVQQKSFPFGQSLVTTVDYSEALNFQQHLLSFVVTTTKTWDGSMYQITGTTASDGRVDTQMEQTDSIHRVYPITLGGAGPDSGSLIYRLALIDFGLTTDGRIVSQMRVTFFNLMEEAEFPFFSIKPNVLPVEVVESEPLTIPHQFPRLMLIFALVDVGSGEVIASTAPPTLTVNLRPSTVGFGSRDRAPSATVFNRTEFVGGPQNGEVTVSSSETGIRFCHVGEDEQLLEMGEVVFESGTLAANVVLVREEIANVGFPSEIRQFEEATRFIFRCATEQLPAVGFSVNSTTHTFEFLPPRSMVRVRPGSTPGEAVLWLTNFDFDVERVLLWQPELGSAEVRHETEEEIESIGNASADFVLTEAEESGDTINYSVVSLRGELSARTFAADRDLSFVLLNPRYLYNLEDLRFYGYQTELQKTPLPAQLKEFAGSRSRTDYHVVKLP